MVKQAEKKQPAHKAILPAMGLVLAVTYGVIAYFLGPIIFDLLIDNVDRIAQRVDQSNEQYFTLAISGVLWFLMLVISMLVVSAAIGEDPEEEFRVLKPRPGDKKQTKKYIRYQEKLSDRRIKQIEEYKKKLAQQESELKKRK